MEQKDHLRELVRATGHTAYAIRAVALDDGRLLLRFDYPGFRALERLTTREALVAFYYCVEGASPAGLAAQFAAEATAYGAHALDPDLRGSRQFGFLALALRELGRDLVNGVAIGPAGRTYLPDCQTLPGKSALLGRGRSWQPTRQIPGGPR